MCWTYSLHCRRRSKPFFPGGPPTLNFGKQKNIIKKRQRERGVSYGCKQVIYFVCTSFHSVKTPWRRESGGGLPTQIWVKLVYSCTKMHNLTHKICQGFFFIELNYAPNSSFWFSNNYMIFITKCSIKRCKSLIIKDWPKTKKNNKSSFFKLSSKESPFLWKKN